MACVSGMAGAHETTSAVPTEAGLRLGAALALADVRADQPLPSQALRGYLVQGDPGIDRRASDLEHAVVDAGVRWSPNWSAYAAVGWHATDPRHTEAAWLRYQTTPELGAEEGAWVVALSGGRMRPDWGPVWGQAGHMDRFALMPLARQVALNGDWMGDGLQWSAQRAWANGTAYIDMGWWRGQHFPASVASAGSPSLHLAWSQGDWRTDVWGLWAQAKQRGALAQNLPGGHSHATPDCTGLGPGRLCFDGDSPVWGGSVRWHRPEWPLSLQAAYTQRRDEGRLRSINGVAAHTGVYRAGWWQADWALDRSWAVAWREERLQADLRLQGPGAGLLSQEAGWPGSAPVRRQTAVLAWQPQPGWMGSLEWGQERQAGQRVSVLALRWLWRFDALVGGHVP